jgi:polysaccharide export outer membrane protein
MKGLPNSRQRAGCCAIAGALVLCAGMPELGGQDPSGQTEPRAFTMVNGNPEYLIGKGDRLKVTVWNGETVEEVSLQVAEDGTVFVPFGVNRNIKVEGLSSSALKQTIREGLLKYYVQPEVQVVVAEYRANQAYLLGEVGRQAGGAGLYPLQGRKTVLEFIIEHGGFSENANMLNVRIRTSGGQTLTLNLSDVIFKGDQSQNVIVNPGDVVWVPSKEVGANTYFVFGEVRQPGAILSQTDMTLIELISKAGSFTPDASRTDVFLVRGDPQHPEVVRVDFRRVLERGELAGDRVVRNRDLVYVPRRKLAQFRDVLAIALPILYSIQTTAYLGTTLK